MLNPRKAKLKRSPKCDYHGICKNKAYCEVYPSLLGGKHEDKGWSYLCRKHFSQEQERFNGNLASCILK